MGEQAVVEQNEQVVVEQNGTKKEEENDAQEEELEKAVNEGQNEREKVEAPEVVEAGEVSGNGVGEAEAATPVISQQPLNIWADSGCLSEDFNGRIGGR